MALLLPSNASRPMSGVLRGFPSAEYHLYASTKTLVRPCSSKKLLIYELETYAAPNTCQGIYGWALTSNQASLFCLRAFTTHGGCAKPLMIISVFSWHKIIFPKYRNKCTNARQTFIFGTSYNLLSYLSFL
jgi:hypothetical protein